jgi:uncharacterized membrane protein YqgA involved in biofilm formation
MTVQLALWLSLLGLLTALSVYESLHDALPDWTLSLACIVYAGALLALATTPEQLLQGFAAGGAGFAMGLLSRLGRGRFLDSRAPLCVGLVAGWPGILAVGVGWGLLSGIVALYFLLTDRARELPTVSLLPFLTLSALFVFALRATVLP